MSTSQDPARLLAELVEAFGPDLVHQHRWFDERDRWIELVLAIAARCTDRSEHDVRAACEELARSGVLDHSDQIREPANAEIIETTLRRHGLSADESARTLTALSEVSIVLNRDYGGKLQRYLRHCLELVAEHMRDRFPMSTLNGGDALHAFTFWLQNVVAAPVSLAHPDAREFCRSRGVDWEQLVAAADEADVSLPLLDDMVHAAVSRARNPSH